MSTPAPKEWRPPTCECGHTAAEHKSAGSGFAVRAGRGICLHDGCDCKSFQEVQPNDCPACGATDCTPATCPGEGQAA